MNAPMVYHLASKITNSSDCLIHKHRNPPPPPHILKQSTDEIVLHRVFIVFVLFWWINNEQWSSRIEVWSRIDGGRGLSRQVCICRRQPVVSLTNSRCWNKHRFYLAEVCPVQNDFHSNFLYDTPVVLCFLKLLSDFGAEFFPRGR